MGHKRVKDVAQAFLLFLTVGQDIQPVTFQQIILQGRNEQFEILVEERLRGNLTMHGSLCLPFHPCAEAYLTEALYVSLKLRSRQQFPFSLHLLQNLLLLHLRGPFEPFGQGLLREALAVNAVHGIRDETEVLGSQDGMLRQETYEGNQV